MAIKKYPLQAFVRWKHVFGKTYLIIVPIAALLVAAVLFILQSSNLKSSMAEFTGEISGLAPLTNGTASRSAIINIVDPGTAQLIVGKEVKDNLSSYQIKASPGWRMAILKVWDFDSKKMYVGASRAFNVSEGETYKANIVVKETGTFNDISAAVSIKPAIFDIFHTLSKSLIAYAAEEKPVLVVIHKPGPHGPYSFEVSVIETILAIDGNYVQAIDEQSLGVVGEERNLESLTPDAYGDFTPRNPNFVVELDIKFKVNWPVVTISLINVGNQEVIWKDTTDSRVETKAYGFSNVVELAADKLVKSLSGKGPNPVQFPKFTPSVPKPVKSPAEWGARMRKALGLDKQSESGTGVAGPQTGSGPQSPPPPTTISPCDFNGFISCRDKFNLQGCIDACPLVNKTCPEGTSPDTECKETDGECSNKCWNQGSSHGSQRAAMNHCSMKEVEDRLRAQ